MIYAYISIDLCTEINGHVKCRWGGPCTSGSLRCCGVSGGSCRFPTIRVTSTALEQVLGVPLPTIGVV